MLIAKIVLAVILLELVGGLIVTLCIRKWGIYGDTKWNTNK